MLAEDWESDKVRFPVIAQPKIDGVRSLCLNPDGICTGRSLKKHGNRYVTQYFSRPEFRGLDGEMAAEHETHPDLCRITSSALSKRSGDPYILWHVFDLVTPETVYLAYSERLNLLRQRVEQIQYSMANHGKHIRLIKWQICRTMPELLYYEEQLLNEGYEGVILRDPNGTYKCGRSTVREGGLLRIKRFVDAEIVVTSIQEGERNGNEAQTNELGQTFRSTHKEGMVPNKMVGAMTGVLTADLKGFDGELLFAKGETLRVGAGRMTHSDRVLYFAEPHRLLGKTIKFRLFPRGVKDKPRFPTFQSIRSPEDQ
jgi:DNA ligase-1